VIILHDASQIYHLYKIASCSCFVRMNTISVEQNHLRNIVHNIFFFLHENEASYYKNKPENVYKYIL